MSELLRFVLSAVFMAVGVVSILLSVTGVFKFRFVMNRMHCAAVTDTMGALWVLAALIVASGGVTEVVKLVTILILLWVGTPIASHLVGRMEVATDPELIEHVKLKKNEGKEKSSHG